MDVDSEVADHPGVRRPEVTAEHQRRAVGLELADEPILRPIEGGFLAALKLGLKRSRRHREAGPGTTGDIHVTTAIHLDRVGPVVVGAADERRPQDGSAPRELGHEHIGPGDAGAVRPPGIVSGLKRSGRDREVCGERAAGDVDISRLVGGDVPDLRTGQAGREGGGQGGPLTAGAPRRRLLHGGLAGRGSRSRDREDERGQAPSIAALRETGPLGTRPPRVGPRCPERPPATRRLVARPSIHERKPSMRLATRSGDRTVERATHTESVAPSAKDSAIALSGAGRGNGADPSMTRARAGRPVHAIVPRVSLDRLREPVRRAGAAALGPALAP